MGYRSEVRCLIYGPEDKLGVFITSHQLILNSSVFTHFKDSLTKYSAKVFDTSEPDNTKIIHVLDLYGDSWKWYDGYEDVQAWHNFMEEAAEFGLDYEFARVGEGDGNETDIDFRSTESVYNLLYIGTPAIHEEIDKIAELSL